MESICLPPIPDIYQLPSVSHGISGWVFKLSNEAVVKIALGKENQPALDIEYAIYQRLGHHPYITKFICQRNGMLVLERLQYPLRKRLMDLYNAGKVTPLQHLLRWALQLTDAFSYIHSCDILQVDIGAHNALLDWNDDLKLSDFAGSSIDGSTPTVLPSIKSQNPSLPEEQPSIESEMFAIGSMLYEIETTRQPYHDKSDSEIKHLFTRGEFPDTNTLLLGQVITSCWKFELKKALEVKKEIETIQQCLERYE